MIFFFVFLVKTRAIDIWPESTSLADIKYLTVPPSLVYIASKAQ